MNGVKQGTPGEWDRADKTPEEGIDVGMEMPVLILMDGTVHFAQGNEVMLPKLGAADSVAESQNPKVGWMEVGILWTTGHNGMAVMAVFYSGLPSGWRPWLLMENYRIFKGAGNDCDAKVQPI